MKKIIAVLFILSLLISPCQAATPLSTSHVYFSPKGGCTKAIADAIGQAKQSIPKTTKLYLGIIDSFCLSPYNNNVEHFSVVAKWLSNKAAQPFACILAFLIILVWGLFGLLLHFNNTWQLIISTLAAIISIIMLFIIQNSQNRHTIAIQLKLDEIIRATKGAHNEMMDIEKLTDEDLARIQKKYGLMAEQTKEDLKKGKIDTHTHDVDLSPIIKTPQG